MHNSSSRLGEGASGTINLQSIYEELDNYINEREAGINQSDRQKSPFKHAQSNN